MKRYNQVMSANSDRSHPFPWKAAAPSLALSAVLLAVTVCAASVLFVNHQATAAAIDNAAAGLNAAIELEKTVEDLRDGVTEYAESRDEAKLRELMRSSAARRMAGKTIVLSPDGRLLFGEIYQSLSNVDEDLHKLAVAEQEAQRQRILEAVRQLLEGDLLAQADHHRKVTNDALQAAHRENQRLVEWTGWTLLVLGVGGTAAGILSGFSLARALRRQLVDLSVSVRTAAGSLEPVTDAWEPVAIDPSGDLTQVQSMVDRLSERVGSVVSRLQAAEREAMRKDQLAALGQLAAGLAHELRNPLTSIKTIVEAAREPGPANGLDDRDLEVIEEEISRLDTTLQSFLDYARPPKLARRRVDLLEIVTRTIQLVAPQADRQHVEIAVHAPREAVHAIVDPEQIRQVLLNLLLNAIDALPDGGQIDVSIDVDPTGDAVRLLIEDNGPGIDRAIKERLFEPFQSSKPSGTGLGLTICRRIVANHGGTIAATDRVGGGTVFTVKLPRHEESTSPHTISADAHAVDHR
ncbi:MAG: hypothetical protein KDA75_07345 [Planctomycetaceae bacterium]|nr:hypothetical protein [Planctomycetaceae bacterium]